MKQSAVAVLVLLAFLPSCFHYVPGDLSTERGDLVRVDLVEPVQVDLGEMTANRIMTVDGHWWGVQRDTLIVSATQAVATNDRIFFPEGRSVHIPISHISEVRLRRVDPVRTTLVVVGITAATVVLSAAIGGGFSGGDGPGNGGEPQ